MTIIVTGAAGFIGSNLVKALNEKGIHDIIAVDNLSNAAKFHNLVDCDIRDFVAKENFLSLLAHGHFGMVRAIFHEGACSDTMEHDGRYMMENNYHYSKQILDYCLRTETQFLYASSAAVYGGSASFKEDRLFEKPLNIYGYSKFLFDQIVRQHLHSARSQIAGFRYFNVYGFREQHKGRMASVAFHNFNQFQAEGKVKLFGNYNGYADGCQMRDFVSVEDVVKVNLFFLENPQFSGVYNLGTGQAQAFNDIAVTVVNSIRKHQNLPVLSLQDMIAQGLLEYTPFPDALKGKYQSFTQADIGHLRHVGYTSPFLRVQEGVARYVDWLLMQ